MTRKGLTEKVIFVQRPDAGYGATICGKQKFQAEQQVAAGTLLQRPWMETFPEDWKNCKKASSSGRVRVEGSEVKEGTGGVGRPLGPRRPLSDHGSLGSKAGSHWKDLRRGKMGSGLRF